MANRYVPGGSVTTGARAQEETLCRQSTLYPSLGGIQYPLPEFGGAVVPNVQFFRDDAYQGIEPFTADVFLSAAYDCNIEHDRGYDRPAPGPDGGDDMYATGMRRKIRTMLRFAMENGKK
jgi:hypothetical protein